MRQLGFGVFVVFIVVFAFHVDGNKAREYQRLTRGAEQVGVCANGQVHTHGIIFGLRHLAGQGALPDHFIQFELFVVQVLAHARRCARNVSRANRLVRLLRIFGFGFVHDGRLGQVVCIKVLFHVITDLHHRFGRQAERVGTHIGNQTDGAAANVHTFIELLRHAHGAAGGETKFTHGFLLQSRRREWCGRAAAALFFLYARDGGFAR